MILYLFFKNVSAMNKTISEVRYMYSSEMLTYKQLKQYQYIAFEGIYSSIQYDRSNNYSFAFIDLGTGKEQEEIWILYNPVLLLDADMQYTIFKDKSNVLSNVHTIGCNIPVDDFETVNLNNGFILQHIVLSDCVEVPNIELEKIHFIWNTEKEIDYGYSKDFRVVKRLYIKFYGRINRDFMAGFIIRPVGSPVYFENNKFTCTNSDNAKQVLCKELDSKELARLELLL